MNRLQRVQAFCYHALFPNRCPFCDCVIPYLAESCADCAAKVHRLGQPQIDLFLETALDEAVALYPYQSHAKEAVWNLKFNGCQQAAIPMARAMAHLAREHPEWNAQVLVPVPLSRAKHYRRGYNQAEELGRTLALELGLPLETRALRKTRATSDQHTLSAVERAENLTGAFRVFRPEGVRGKRVLLLDDVYTTGWTMHECARALKAAGAAAVIGFAFCKAGAKEDGEPLSAG